MQKIRRIVFRRINISRPTYSQKTDPNNDGKQKDEKCEKHGKELVLYCSKQMCQKPICLSCLTEDHKKHDVIDIKDQQEKEDCRKEFKNTMEYLKEHIDYILETKTNIAVKVDVCIEELRKTKEGFIKEVNKMIEEAEIVGNKTREESDHVVSTLKTSLELLNSIKENIEDKDGTNGETIQNYRGTVQRVMENNKENLPVRSFKCPVLRVNGLSVDIISGRTNNEEIAVSKCTGMFCFKNKCRKLNGVPLFLSVFL